MNIFRALKEYFIHTFQRKHKPLIACKVEELPDVLDSKCIYVVGEGSYNWFTAMICPCGCGETLYMSLLPDDSPRWDITMHRDGTVSLYPSVWRKKGCKSHFFLRNGYIIWHKTFQRNLDK